MQRTIKDIYELIQQKRENAVNDNKRPHTLIESYQLQGEIDAYTDVLRLIETSGVLENAKQSPIN